MELFKGFIKIIAIMSVTAGFTLLNLCNEKIMKKASVYFIIFGLILIALYYLAFN